MDQGCRPVDKINQSMEGEYLNHESPSAKILRLVAVAGLAAMLRLCSLILRCRSSLIALYRERKSSGDLCRAFDHLTDLYDISNYAKLMCHQTTTNSDSVSPRPCSKREVL